MQAASIDASQWWARPRGDHASKWIANYQQSLNARHRTAISQIVGEINPASLLEVGCHCAPNLIRLAGEYPQLKCAGCDVNEDAIKAGKAWADLQHLSDRIDLSVGTFPQATDHLPNNCVDVVLTCYAVGAYMAKDDLVPALYELGRLAKKAVILAEPMLTGPTQSKQSMNGYTEWHHDYRDAISWVSTLNTRRQRLVPVDPPVDSLSAILVLES